MLVTATINAKYQIVIPKQIRKLVSGLKPGSKVQLKAIDEHTMELNLENDPVHSWIKKSFGIAKGAWGPDSAKWLKQQRKSWKAYEWQK